MLKRRLLVYALRLYLQNVKRLVLPKDIIKYSVKKHRDKIAVIDGGHQMTYGELYERAASLANGLKALGLAKGDKLAVLIYNCREYFEIRIATYLTGIVIVPIIWDMGTEDVIFILNDCGAKAFIYHPEILSGRLDDIKSKTAVKNYIPLPYENLITDNPGIEPSSSIDPDDLASINFSSGTTGRPKGVMLSHKNWANSFYNFITNAAKTSKGSATVLHMLSLSTSGSTSFLIFSFIGAKNVIAAKPDIESGASLIAKHGVNTIFLSPSLFIDLFDYFQTNKMKPSFSSIIVGTEAMPLAKLKEAIDYFGPVIQRGYGMVEVLPPLTLLSPGDTKLSSVGKALIGVEIKAVDENGAEVSSGKTGRIVVRSSTVSKGYWQQPETNSRAYKDGAFFSNDLGYQDEDGYWYILGRKEDIIKEDGGKKYFVSQVEDILHEHPAVLLACVSKNENGKVAAFVSLRRGRQNVRPEDLRAFFGPRLAKEGFSAPDVFAILPKMPIRATGKIDRNKIKESK